MNGLANSPLRNLLYIVAFMVVVIVAATAAYMVVGWSFLDAFYMVLLTVFTVGYEEVHPINTPELHAITITSIVLGCTGMIMLTGVLVQVLTFSQLRQFLGATRVKTDINRLKGHVIVCGYGRIGTMLAKDLAAGGVHFVILDRDEERLSQARALGYLCWPGDATDEDALRQVGIERAKLLATVLPDDAANVFITLSARSLNPALQIIARGEAPSTENKLLQAGANQVVLPTHIGAERIAELVLFPETARYIRGSDRMREFEKTLADLGMDIEVIVAGEATPLAGRTVAELEARAQGALLVVQINRRNGEIVTRPPAGLGIEVGDGVVVIGREEAVSTLLASPADGPRPGDLVL
jgi:voltage-gated potassium channel